MPGETSRSLNESPSMDIPSGEVMIQSWDTVILVKNHPDQGLVKGDKGSWS